MKEKIVNGSLVCIGTCSLVLGLIGIVLPLLPTTPFLLLSAGCYMRGSKKFYHWLINNKWIGSYIKNYQEGHGIPLNGKIISILTLWITILISAFLIISNILIQSLLLIIAIGVTIHIVTMRTYKKNEETR